jgi:integrase
MGIYKRKNKWFLDYYFQGKRIREAANTTNKSIAEDMLAARKADILRDKFKIADLQPNMYFSQLAEEYLAYAKENKKSWKRDETSLKHLKPFFENRRLAEITARMIEKYKSKRTSDGVSPATINRELSCMKHMYNLAIVWEMARENPAARVKLFRERNKRMEFLIPEEIERLLKEVSEHARPVVITALKTGMRLGEILGLTWNDVDLVKNEIILDETKSGASRRIPISGELKHTLLGLESRKSGGHVFLNKYGKRMKSVRNQFESALKRAGIKRKITFHDLRHTFASQLVMKGVDLVTVKELLGHKTIQMTMRYAHLTSEHKKRAVYLIGGKPDEEYGHKTVTNGVSEKVRKPEKAYN